MKILIRIKVRRVRLRRNTQLSSQTIRLAVQKRPILSPVQQSKSKQCSFLSYFVHFYFFELQIRPLLSLFDLFDLFISIFQLKSLFLSIFKIFWAFIGLKSRAFVKVTHLNTNFNFALLSVQNFILLPFET